MRESCERETQPQAFCIVYHEISRNTGKMKFGEDRNPNLLLSSLYPESLDSSVYAYYVLRLRASTLII